MQLKLKLIPLAALALTIAVSNPMMAKPGEAGGDGPRGARGARFLEQLNLTEAQKEQIKPLLKESMDQRQAINKDTTLSAEQKKDKLRQVQRDSMEKIGAVLTEEQKTKLKEIRKERAARAGKGGAQKADGRKAEAPKADN